jgi:hypothetical protein
LLTSRKDDVTSFNAAINTVADCRKFVVPAAKLSNPRTSTRFFDKYQDRILFGSDAGLRQVLAQDVYRIYYRFLETEDEYFDYAPSRIPPQSRWRIDDLGLPESILRKVYHENAERVLGVKLTG